MPLKQINDLYLDTNISVTLWLYIIVPRNFQQKCRWVKVFSKKSENRGYIECLSFLSFFIIIIIIASVVTSFRLYFHFYIKHNNSYLCSRGTKTVHTSYTQHFFLLSVSVQSIVRYIFNIVVDRIS